LNLLLDELEGDRGVSEHVYWLVAEEIGGGKWVVAGVHRERLCRNLLIYYYNFLHKDILYHN